MSFLTDFGDLLTDTIMVQRIAGRDEYSRPLVSAPIELLGRLERKQRRILLADNTEKLVVATFFTAETPVIHAGDLVTLDDGSGPPVIAVERMPDDRGQYYQAVMLGA